MKSLFRIAATVLFASSLFAGGEALAQGKGRGGDRERGWERSERGWRGDRDRGDRGERWDRGERRDYGPRDGFDPGGPAFSRGPPPGYGVRRGGLVPPEYRGAVVPDYGRHRLRPPPPGFAWVRMGGRYALVSRSTGQIFDVIGD